MTTTDNNRTLCESKADEYPALAHVWRAAGEIATEESLKLHEIISRRFEDPEFMNERCYDLLDAQWVWHDAADDYDLQEVVLTLFIAAANRWDWDLVSGEFGKMWRKVERRAEEIRNAADQRPPAPKPQPEPAAEAELPPPRKGGRPPTPSDKTRLFILMAKDMWEATENKRGFCRDFLRRNPEAKALFDDEDNLRNQFRDWLEKKR